MQLRQHLRQQLEEIKDKWACSHYTAPTADETALLNANALGQAEVLRSLLESTTPEANDSFLEQAK